MFEVHKIGLIAIAFGIMTAPALAQMGNPELDRGATQSFSAVHNDFDPFESRFNDFDTNGDNEISEDEFSSHMDADVSVATFSELDVDLNGSLDQQEFAMLFATETDTAADAR